MNIRNLMTAVLVSTVCAIMPFSSFAVEGDSSSSGGSTGGGGKTRRSALATEADIKATIHQARMIAPLFINGMDLTVVQAPEAMLEVSEEFLFVANTLVKQGAKRAIEINKQSKLVIQTAACSSPRGPTHASADRKTLTLCFSVGEILKQKHSLYEIDSKITALYLHELSHLVALDGSISSESKAEIFQEELVAVLIRYNFETIMNQNNVFTWLIGDSLTDYLKRFGSLTMCESEQSSELHDDQKLFAQPFGLFTEYYRNLVGMPTIDADIIAISPIDYPTWSKMYHFSNSDCKARGKVSDTVQMIRSSMPEAF